MAPYSPALALNARPQQPHLLCFARRLQRLSTPGDQRPPVTEPCAASLTLRLHMHGLIYETSIHVRQNQPGSRLCRSSSRHSRSFPHRSSCFLHHLPQRSALRVATLHRQKDCQHTEPYGSSRRSHIIRGIIPPTICAQLPLLLGHSLNILRRQGVTCSTVSQPSGQA